MPVATGVPPHDPEYQWITPSVPVVPFNVSVVPIPPYEIEAAPGVTVVGSVAGVLTESVMLASTAAPQSPVTLA